MDHSSLEKLLGSIANFDVFRNNSHVAQDDSAIQLAIALYRFGS